MPNKEQYQNLKNKIYLANPEIMEFKFGNYIKKGSDIGIILDKDLAFFNRSWMDYGENIYKITDNDDFELLGRKITFADVLVAIDEKEGDCDDTYFVTMGGEFYQCSAGNNYTPRVTGIWWNRKDNNLDNQNDEVKQFLYDLLCQK